MSWSEIVKALVLMLGVVLAAVLFVAGMAFINTVMPV